MSCFAFFWLSFCFFDGFWRVVWWRVLQPGTLGESQGGEKGPAVREMLILPLRRRAQKGKGKTASEKLETNMVCEGNPCLSSTSPSCFLVSCVSPCNFCWWTILAVLDGCTAGPRCSAAVGFLTDTCMVGHPASCYCSVIHLCEASNEENKPFQDVMKTKL